MGNTFGSPNGSSIGMLINPDHVDFFGQTMLVVQLEPDNIDYSMMSSTPGKNKTGWFELIFNDYEHFASCMLGKNLTNVSISWKNAPVDLEIPNDTTLHKHLSALSDKAVMFRILIKKPLRIDSRTDEERGGPAIYQYVSSATELLLDGIESVEIL